MRADPDTGAELGVYDAGRTPTGGWDGERLWYADQAARRLVALALR